MHERPRCAIGGHPAAAERGEPEAGPALAVLPVPETIPMRLFECQACSQPLYFENSGCESCGRRLGFLPERREITALDWAGDHWRALAAPERPVRFCANAEHGFCNWLVATDDDEPFCLACRHNRTIPDLGWSENGARWRRLEEAKRRLFYTLLSLRLPLTRRPEDPQGLAFDFLADLSEGVPQAPPLLTGHDNGLITINIAEADDAERERRRHAMGEPYRTLLGHFRHEVGHYYWTVLVERAGEAVLAGFRAAFGDERADYGSALQRHYAEGPPPDWQTRYISAYASAHPWEDWAETFAHYLHMVDTLETAAAFGLRVRPRVSRAEAMSTDLAFDPHRVQALERLVEAWLPLTFAVNSLNRSMGQPDLYPFLLAPTVIGKLAFVHERVWEVGAETEVAEADLLKAVAAGLRRRVGSPPAR
jgi:hypothetical protein